MPHAPRYPHAMPNARPAHHALRRCLPAWALAAFAAGMAQAAPPLRLLVFPSPGLFDVQDDGHVGGPGGVLLAKIGRASELPYEAESLPIARAWNEIRAQPLSCVLGMTRTPDREARFQWVAPVSRADFIVYGRADAPALPPDLTVLRGHAVVVLRETVTATQLHEHGVAAQEVSSTLSALRMLQAGRVDYWYSHQLLAEPAARAAGGPPIKPLFSTARIDGYLACNLEVPAPVIDKLRQTLQRLRRNGDLAEFGLR